MNFPKRRTAMLAGLAVLSGLGGVAWLRKRNTQNPRLALPILGANTALRIVYGHSPRFDRADSGLIAAVLARAQELCKSHFGLNITFSAVEEQSIDVLFRGITPHTIRRIKSLVYDHKNGTGDRKRLIDTTRKSLANYPSTLEAQIGYARPYLDSKVVPVDLATLAEALADTQLARFADWLALKDVSGRSLIDDLLHNEFLTWGFGPLTAPWTFEVVITNQLLASIEYHGNSIHSALRGGITNGMTTESYYARYGNVSIVSLFPVLNQAPVARRLRGEKLGIVLDPVESAASVLTHELGHQLLHLNHPYGREACIMSPTALLQFDSWTKGLDEKKCPLDSPGNERGKAHFEVVGKPVP